MEMLFANLDGDNQKIIRSHFKIHALNPFVTFLVCKEKSYNTLTIEDFRPPKKYPLPI
jgi:hypothetical protein